MGLSPPRLPSPEIVQAQAWVVTAASEQERAQVGALSPRLQEVTGAQVAVAFVDPGYTGEAAGIKLWLWLR